MSGTDEAPSNASNNLTTTDEFPSISNASIIAAIDSLTSTGVKWRPVIDVNGVNVHTLADIPHGNDSPQQALDLYFSDDALKTEAKRPVYIHIHGGGWSRGGKSSPFYGGPALCQNAAAAGCVAVAPGYRLGQYPDFVEDAANAIKWVKGNIEQFGGDLSNVFLSDTRQAVTLLHFSFSGTQPFLPHLEFRSISFVVSSWYQAYTISLVHFDQHHLIPRISFLSFRMFFRHLEVMRN
jgi:hypothetical protein